MNTVQWWCSARGQPWDGSWQAYPGVWLFVIAVAVLFWRLRPPADAPVSPWRRAATPIGLAWLWITLDWPVGPLGAGYLASVHSFQFLMLAMFVPPLLLLGIDRDRVAAWLAARPRAAAIVTTLTKPLLVMIIFAVTMILTHLPRIVDALMATQPGAFALDLAWFAAGLLFWWPVIIRLPVRPHFPPLMQMLYLFFGTQPHLYIAMWLLGARFPVYGTYELAPRVLPMSALTDQQIAGGVMLGLGGTFVIAVITVVFFQWMATQERAH